MTIAVDKWKQSCAYHQINTFCCEQRWMGHKLRRILHTEICVLGWIIFKIPWQLFESILDSFYLAKTAGRSKFVNFSNIVIAFWLGEGGSNEATEGFYFLYSITGGNIVYFYCKATTQQRLWQHWIIWIINIIEVNIYIDLLRDCNFCGLSFKCYKSMYSTITLVCSPDTSKIRYNTTSSLLRFIFLQ